MWGNCPIIHSYFNLIWVCFNLHIDWNAVSEGKKSILSTSTFRENKTDHLKKAMHILKLYMHLRDVNIHII